MHISLKQQHHQLFQSSAQVLSIRTFLFSTTINSKNSSWKVNTLLISKNGRNLINGKDSWQKLLPWLISRLLTLAVSLLILQNWRNLILFWRRRKEMEIKYWSSARWLRCLIFLKISWIFENTLSLDLMELATSLTGGTWSTISKNLPQKYSSSFYLQEQVPIYLSRWSRCHPDSRQYRYFLR